MHYWCHVELTCHVPVTMARTREAEGRGISCRCPLVVDRSRMCVDGHRRHHGDQLSTVHHAGWKFEWMR